jgi:hypothetical protein
MIEIASYLSQLIGVYMRIDMFVDDAGDIYVQEYSPNHMVRATSMVCLRLLCFLLSHTATPYTFYFRVATAIALQDWTTLLVALMLAFLELCGTIWVDRAFMAVRLKRFPRILVTGALLLMKNSALPRSTRILRLRRLCFLNAQLHNLLHDLLRYLLPLQPL